MSEFFFPKSQSELLRAARGDLTQVEFARQLGVDRSCLSRYESEKLGAPAKVINYCLAKVADTSAMALPETEIDRALLFTQSALRSLRRAKGQTKAAKQ